MAGCTLSIGESPERSAEEPVSVLASYAVLANCVGSTVVPVASPVSGSGTSVAGKVSQAVMPDTYTAAGASQYGEPDAEPERTSAQGSC